jgi:predicted bacteriocin transport accessory protein
MKKKIFIIIYLIVLFYLIIVASSLISYYKGKKEVKKTEEVELYTEINLGEFLSLYYGKELSFIYIGSKDCSHCDTQNEIFKNTTASVNFTVFYLDIDKVSTSNIDEYIKPMHSDFMENGVSTPTLLLVSNGEVVMYKKGVTSELDILKLLLKYEYLK